MSQSLKQTKQTKHASSKQPKQQKEKPFSSTVITNFLNNYYRNVAMKNPNEQSLNFKVFPTGDNVKVNQQALTIDLYTYQGLLDFIETYKLATELNHEQTIENVIDITFDMKLRACLDTARVFKTNDKTKLNTFQEFIIPQLGFNSDNIMNIVDYINGVSSYFSNDSKLKTKIYNLVFPHDSHDQSKLPVGVNVIYLQHVSKYHDEVLNLVINKYEKDDEDEKVLLEVQKLFANEFEGPSEVKLQLLNPQIAKTIMNPPMTTIRGKRVIDPSWVDNLKAVEMGGTRRKPEVVETERALTNEEVKAIKLLNRELLIVKSFIKIIRGGKNARRVEKNEKGDDVAVPVNADLKQCLSEYNRVYNETRKFFEDWKAIIQSELARIDVEKEKVKYTTEETDEKVIESLIKESEDEQQYELFLKYFVSSVRFIKNKLHYSSPFKTFINDVKKDVVFKFNKGLRSKLESLVNQEQEPIPEQIAELAKFYFKDWRFINSPKTYDPNDLSIYSKIGKFCDLPIKKEYRVAIGIALVAFIQEQIALLKAANRRKKELQIYIKSEKPVIENK